ncbi:MAG: nickel insertion protein, partial [Chloroflexota bacterium]
MSADHGSADKGLADDSLAEEGLETVVQLECNLDDMTGEELGYALERLLEAGALDAWFTPIYMKKNRPAVLLDALCRPEDAERLREALLEHTTTLGVRWQTMQRMVAGRAWVTVPTPWGAVRVKLKRLGGRVRGCKPEFDDCARLARAAGVPVSAVMEAARR